MSRSGVPVSTLDASIVSDDDWNHGRRHHRHHGGGNGQGNGNGAYTVAATNGDYTESAANRTEDWTSGYNAGLLNGTGLVAQAPAAGCDPVLAHFVVRVVNRDRDTLARTLLELGIETKPYFPALHRTTHPDPAWVPDALPVTERLHREALALPLSSEMTARDIDRVLVGIERAGALVPAAAGPRPAHPVPSATAVT